MKQMISLVALTVFLLFAISACAPAAQPTPAPAATTAPTQPTTAPAATQAAAPTVASAATQPPAAASVELHMLWYNDGNEGDVMRDLLNRYEAANPGIKVVMDTVAYKDIHNILQTQVDGGTPPDLARVTDVARFTGKYLDMRSYMTDPTGWAAAWPPQVLQSFRTGSDTTGLYGFPTQFTVTGPFINRTLFQQAGVPVPSDTKKDVTWDEWVTAAKQVATATKTPYAIAIDRTGHRFWGPSLSNCAHYVDSASSKTFTIDTPGFRETANMLVSWHTQKITPLDIWVGSGSAYAAGNDYFVNGQLVMYMSGSWQIGQFAKLIGTKFEWDAIPNPSGKCGSTGIPGGALLGAMAGTKHPKEVTKLVEWLSSDDVLGEFSARTLFIPGKLTLAKKGIQYPSSNKQLNVFLAEIPKLMPEAYALQYHPLTFVLNTEIRDRLSQVITGELTLDQAIQKIQQKMDDAVKTMK